MIGHIHPWAWITGHIQHTASNASVPSLKSNNLQRASLPQKRLCPQACGLKHSQIEKHTEKGQMNPSSNSRFQQSKQFLWPVTSGCSGISPDKVPAPKPVAWIICSGHFTALAKRELQEHFTREWINARSPDTALQFIMLMDHSSSFIFAQKDPKKPSEASAGGHVMHLRKWTILSHTHFTWRV